MTGFMRDLAPLLGELKRDILTEMDRRLTLLTGPSHTSNHRDPAGDCVNPVGGNRTATYASALKEPTIRRSGENSAPRPPPLAVGTAAKIAIGTVAAPTPKLWLFLSRLATDVTEEQVSDMVSKSLDAKDVLVKRLLPKDRDLSTVSFLSFRVGVPLALRDKALDPSTWPNGVLF
ncbi:uncharacterized protein LOC128276649, partial [Anopheles cruzii]|uniref:uncharacterized protein LOC128276649 n=1 Tax=Anopheles cruzii TaxID=68878 RepID=UPI0022EC957A